MSRYVALWRGINVGTAKRIAMADLRLLLESLGYTQVQTLLNSGNAVFTGNTATAMQHAQRIREAVTRELGVDAGVIVKTASEIATSLAACPWIDEAPDPSQLLVAFTDAAQHLVALQPLCRQAMAPERLEVDSHAAYLWCANGIRDSKLAAALMRQLGDHGTTRNWATVQKIRALLEPPCS